MAIVGENARKWWLLGAMGAILGVVLLDETVVGVALPTIQQDLDMSEVASHWVVNVYMLVLAGLAAAAGKLADIIGHRILISAGLAIFGLASVACGFSESGTWLIAARGVQGIGAAIIFPSSLAMVTGAFSDQQRGLVLGIYGAIGTTFLALGPLIGGFLTDVASWRWIFWVNPPIVLAVTLIVIAAWVEPVPLHASRRIDWTGLVLLVVGLVMVIFAIMHGPDWGWANPIIWLLLVVGAVLLIAFVMIERRIIPPLIDVELFANPTFASSNLVIFCAQFSKMTVLVFGAGYLQDILKMSPLVAGLALLPTVAPQPLVGPLAGHAADRLGVRQPLLGGLFFVLAGFVWISMAMAGQNYAWMFPGFLLWGFAMNFLWVPPRRAIMDAVSQDKRGQAGGVAMSSQLLGGTVGVAACSAVFTMTNNYQAVFLANALFVLVVLTVAWSTVDPRSSAGDRSRRA